MTLSPDGGAAPRRGFARLAAALALVGAACAPLAEAAATAAMESGQEQGLLCRAAIRQAETGSGLPPYMLAGIARVESGRSDPVTRRVHPWPWTINTEGRDHIFDTKADAVAFARGLQARGMRSFDAGCLQVNLMYHPEAFQSLEEAFDPLANARYAVRFLSELRDRTGSWETASAWYHSANPAEGTPYRGKVVAAMATEAQLGTAYAALPAPVPTAAGLPPRFGGVMALAGVPRGMVTGMVTGMATGLSAGRAYAGLAGAGLRSAPAQTIASPGAGMAGRGLDAYRMRPVAIAGQLLAAIP
jgi:hypothetical protein